MVQTREEKQFCICFDASWKTLLFILENAQKIFEILILVIIFANKINLIQYQFCSSQTMRTNSKLELLLYCNSWYQINKQASPEFMFNWLLHCTF